MGRHADGPATPRRRDRLTAWYEPELAVVPVVGTAVVLLVGLAVTFVVLMDQRDVWGRPDEQARVVAEDPTGRDRDSGRSTCPESAFELRIERPAPGLPPQTRYLACRGDLTVGEVLVVRRVPGRPAATVTDPVPAAEVPLMALGVGVFVAALIGAFQLLSLGAGLAWSRLRRARVPGLAAGPPSGR
jgi:hypothetical protein